MNTNKHVYFVRHGESVTNATGILLGAGSTLTERGEKQAIVVADRLKKLPVTRIIASTYERAVETAKPSAAALGLPVETRAVFRERKCPGILHGLHEDDPTVRAVWDVIATHYGTPGYRHSDEENFEDLCGRAKDGLVLLEQMPEKHILVFSHGLTMKMIFAYVLMGELLNGRIFWERFIQAKNAANTSIMHLEFTDNFHRTEKFWKLISWNDHAHLDGS